jgi:hypothetical protein
MHAAEAAPRGTPAIGRTSLQKLRRWLAPLLLLLYFAQGTAHARHASITFDEGPHLAVGYATLRTGDLRLQPVHIHPPLANALAAAPLLFQDDLPDPRAIDGWDIASLSAVTDEVVWQYPHPARIAIAGRVPILLLGVLLGAVVCRWARDLGGWRAGWSALVFYAFDPNLIAHGSLITTDMAATFFSVATLYAVWRQITKSANHKIGKSGRARKSAAARGWDGLVWSLGVGVLLGLAQLSKVSALLLLPVVGLMYAVALVAEQICKAQNRQISKSASKIQKLVPVSGDPKSKIQNLALSLLVAAFILWAGYSFEVTPVPGLPFNLPAATHLRIFQSLREHYDLGHPTFAIGRVSTHGWWWYFLLAFVVKTPLPTMRFGLWAAWRSIQAAKRRRRAIPWLAVSALLAFPLVYAASSLFSTVNIGYRHLLPMLPFFYVGIGWAMGRAPVRRPRRAGWLAKFRRLKAKTPVSHFFPPSALLLLAFPFIMIFNVPHYLSYFNLLIGGPRNGYHVLVDSNLDWGQNLWDLKDWMAQHEADHVFYAHYSPARPQAYGIAVDFLPPDPRAVDFAPWEPAPGSYAIGATVLQGAYTPSVNTYAWFRARKPDARLGRALMIYRVPPRPAARWAVLCAGAPPVEAPANLGRAKRDLRVVALDCDQAHVVPAGDGPGVYVVPPAVAPPVGATPDLHLRTRDGARSATVYRLATHPAPRAAAPGLDVAGPLDFLGHTREVGGATDARTLRLHTHWRVREVPGRPLSLIAHLVGPDGSAVAVGDAMDFPIEQWQPGDILVQHHTLAVPKGASRGPYTLHTGAYWLDTLERWPVVDAQGAPSGDSIPLAPWEPAP